MSGSCASAMTSSTNSKLSHFYLEDPETTKYTWKMCSLHHRLVEVPCTIADGIGPFVYCIEILVGIVMIFEGNWDGTFGAAQVAKLPHLRPVC
jgi:hypothetical protein